MIYLIPETNDSAEIIVSFERLSRRRGDTSLRRIRKDWPSCLNVSTGFCGCEMLLITKRRDGNGRSLSYVERQRWYALLYYVVQRNG